MIHKITANHDSFRPIRFGPGLNVILADRKEDSSRKDTRNGLGKSTLIEVIHFCLGARVQKGRGLAIPALADWAFTMEVSLGPDRVAVTRRISRHNITTVAGLSDRWPDVPQAGLLGERSFKTDQWRALLGRALFSLPTADAPKYNPSFRSLISYFVRRRHDAFGDPFIHHSRQSTWDKQLHVALLLGLEWRHAVHWQQIKDRGRDLAKLRKLVDQGTVPGLAASTSIGELEAERVARTQEIDDSSMALETFKVHPQYDSIETEANQLTEALHQAVNARVSASRRLKLYRRAVESEEPPSGVAVEPMYEEMGVVFSEAIRRSLAEAKQFYGRVVRDRRRFLQDEITRLERESAEIQVEIAELTEQRAGVLRVLEEHGALAELTSLRERHATKLEELAGITRQIERRREIEADNRRIARDRAELADRAARDYDERRGSWDAAVRLFNRNSQALYAAPGHLVIDATDSGFKFDIDIRKSRSDGIGKMKIFCFDLAVLEACAGRDMGIGFLIHDSEMYDGVDSRQRAAALQRAHQITERTGTQYICALNSDMVPNDDFRDGFTLDEYVRCRLKDGDVSGTLLGIVF